MNRRVGQSYQVISIMSERILNNRSIVLLSFVLYIVFSIYYFNTLGLTQFGPNTQKAFEDATAASLLICFILFLVSTVIQRNLGKTVAGKQQGVPSFLFETVISGFFFAAGSFFCLKGITVDDIKNATGAYQPSLFSWSQICILALLALTVTVFYLFFRFDQNAFFSFIGYVLVLIGLLSLYYGGYRFSDDSFLQLSVLFFAGSQSAAPLTNLIIAGIFWIISITVNQSIAHKYQRHLIWLETLFFSALISVIGVACLSVLYNRDILFYTDFKYESICLYAGFLYLGLQGLLLASEHIGRLSVANKSLKIWGAGVLFLNLLLSVFFHKDFLFMVKITTLCLGIYFIWTPTINFKTVKWGSNLFKFAILLFLGFALVGGTILVVFQIFLYGVWLQDTVLWKYIVLFREYKFSCVLLLSVIATILSWKRYSFANASNIMSRGIILCIMAWLTAGLVQETVISLLTAFITMGNLGWWDSASKETQGMWLGISLMAASVISLIFSLWQCKKGIGRIIVWTVISNALLYKGIGFSIGIGLQQLFVLKGLPARLGVDIHVISAFFLMITPYFILFVLLGLSLILIYFTRMEQSILPKLMNCRMPNSAETEKLEIISSSVFKRTGIPASSYRILIVQNNENNAFSIGRNTVVVTKSLLDRFPVENIVGLIAHELGHLRQRDGHYQFIIDALNIPVHIASSIGSALLKGRTKIAVFALPVFFIIIYSGLSGAVAFGMSRIIFYTLLQTAILIIRKQDFRDSEFIADSFATEHGLGNALKTALLQIGEQKGRLTLWELVMSDYPDFPERIKRLDAIT